MPPEADFRLALYLWLEDPVCPCDERQRDWLLRRLKRLDPFTQQESRKLVPPLLAWSAGRTWEAALIKGLRGVVEDALLPVHEEA